MKSSFANRAVRGYRLTSILLSLLLLVSPIYAQRPAKPAPAPPRQTQPPPDPTFDQLLATDAYKLYGEVRNVGQLLSTGGAGEIVDPIIKLADPGKEFKSIISFLKKNSEALLLSRMLFAGWPARTDLPTVFVAIEFATVEDAAKFAPKLETFLPTVLPPVTPSPEPTPAAPATEPGAGSPAKPARPLPPVSTPTPPPAAPLPFVITRSGNLVCISEKAFKFEKLHPPNAKALFQDQNFRTVRDKFSTEPLFLFFNVALEDKTRPQPSPTPVVSEEEAARVVSQPETTSKQEPAATPTEPEEPKRNENFAVLVAGPEPSPTPTPTKEQQAQAIASLQIGQMLDSLGFGEPQWPDAVGLALALDGSEYVVRALLIDKPGAKLLPIPFVPQLIAGPAYSVEAASVLPDDTEVFLSASIDLTQSYEGMRKQAETKKQTQSDSQVYVNGVLQTQPRENAPDAFEQFEKKAGFKIKDDLLSALGTELAVAGTLKTLQSVNVFGAGAIPAAKPSPEAKDQKQKDEGALPIVLISVRNRDEVRRLMPKALIGLGIGEANLLAQTEKHGDAEIVNYAGMFAYGFVGDFVVLSDTAGVRRVVDANVNNRTLSSNNVYRNARRWQSGRTLGQFYVSTALMEAYHEEIRKEAGSMEPEMRDFLLSLNPKSEAITYALSNDGLGTQHELHLPKNLILTMVAGISNAAKNPPPEANEMVAMGLSQMIAGAQQQYKAGAGKGSYGTMQQLVDAKLIPFEGFDKYGYKFEITVIGDQFEAVATPKEYGKTGKRSFFVDKSGVVRGDDHGGGPATIADKPVRQ